VCLHDDVQRLDGANHEIDEAAGAQGTSVDDLQGVDGRAVCQPAAVNWVFTQLIFYMAAALPAGTDFELS
jgi:hypothetical protein